MAKTTAPIRPAGRPVPGVTREHALAALDRLARYLKLSGEPIDDGLRVYANRWLDALLIVDPSLGTTEDVWP